MRCVVNGVIKPSIMKDVFLVKRQLPQLHFGAYPDEQLFNLSYGGETVSVSFQTRLFPELPSELVFAESVLSSARLSSLTYGIVSLDRQVTCITNEVLASQTLRCSMYPKDPKPFWTLHCTKSSRHYSREKYQCRCRLCVKDKPPSLKSVCK